MGTARFFFGGPIFFEISFSPRSITVIRWVHVRPDGVGDGRRGWVYIVRNKKYWGVSFVDYSLAQAVRIVEGLLSQPLMERNVPLHILSPRHTYLHSLFPSANPLYPDRTEAYRSIGPKTLPSLLHTKPYLQITANVQTKPSIIPYPSHPDPKLILWSTSNSLTRKDINHVYLPAPIV